MEWAQKANIEGLHNAYKVDDNLYRSEQPGCIGMGAVQRQGIQTILNLRLIWNDKNKIQKTNLTGTQIPIRTGKISYEDLVKSLTAINHAKKPILIHCWHGSDRTGCVVAAYRIINNGWTKEQAIHELISGGFGFHQKWFPNIIDLINSLDVEKLKQDVKQ